MGTRTVKVVKGKICSLPLIKRYTFGTDIDIIDERRVYYVKRKISNELDFLKSTIHFLLSML